MSNTDHPRFDAYYKWLGIPRREQPPNHYRILSISLYEADPQLITEAAERQSEVVLSSAKEKFPALGEKLASEIAAARDCLLNPDSKAAYDEELKKQAPKAPPKPIKQSRYDVQATYSADYDIPEVELPSSEAPPDLMYDLKEDPVLDSPKANKAKAVAAIGVASSEKAAPLKPEAPTPEIPVPTKTKPAAGKAATDDINTGKIVRLVVLCCLLAAAITVGLLAWMSSGKREAVSTEIAPAPPAPKPATKPVAALPAPASRPAPAASQPVPARAAATAPAPTALPSSRPAAAPVRRPTTAAATQPAAGQRPTSAPAGRNAAAKSPYWAKIATAVILIQPRQAGQPSVLTMNADGTYESPILGAGTWTMSDTSITLTGKAGSLKLVYNPDSDTVTSEKGSGQIVARRPLPATAPPPAAPANRAPANRPAARP